MEGSTSQHVIPEVDIHVEILRLENKKETLGVSKNQTMGMLFGGAPMDFDFDRVVVNLPMRGSALFAPYTSVSKSTVHCGN
jgi:hypothetical protein